MPCRVMADLLISLVRVAVMGAVAGVPPVQPAWPNGSLPEPMIPGNWEMEGTTCIMQVGAELAPDGFGMKEEGDTTRVMHK